MKQQESQNIELYNAKLAKQTKGLKIACVALSAAVLGLGGLAIFNLTRNNNSNEGQAICPVNQTETTLTNTDASASIEEKTVEYTETLLSEFNYDLLLTKDGVIYMNNNASGAQGYIMTGDTPLERGEYIVDISDTSIEVIGSNSLAFNYKMDAPNIVSVTPIAYGQSYQGAMFALIDKDGNMRVLKLDESSANTSTLTDVIEDYKNVAYTQVVSIGSGVSTQIHFRDGSSQYLPDNF